jgi:hypothetical protein
MRGCLFLAHSGHAKAAAQQLTGAMAAFDSLQKWAAQFAVMHNTSNLTMRITC